MKKHLSVLPILIFLLGLSITYALVTHYSSDGYVIVDTLSIDGNTIIMGNGCKAIIADTSPERAYSIQLGLDKVIVGRPITHDTVSEILKSFNITLEAVKINGYDGQYYYSDMIMSNNEKVLSLDVMPSDAIAIALRLDAPIYINQTLLNEVGLDICE
ncbi:MAG: bifunctional nuclease family protein [Nanoarchaeota archaeon]|nr:bifunctional nuclease family protein [Nanoarchaeota archaeon]